MKDYRSKLGSYRREIQSLVSARIPDITGARVYFGATGAFGEEQRAVLAGKQHHYRDERLHRSQMFLRRSVHRIEKGLISRPLRSSFGADYILRTVNTAIAFLGSNDSLDPEELKWATHVLDRYFLSTVNSTDPRVIKARTKWNSPERPSTESPLSEVRLEPFIQVELPNASEKFESFAQIARHRRSVRFFQDRPVPRELVEQAADVALTAPSACNRQSFRLLIVDDLDLRAKVAAVPMGTAGFAQQIPAIGVLIGQHRGYEHERDRHAIYVDGGLFATGFILALEGLGLNSCCINWPDLKAKDNQIRKLVDLEKDERVIMLIAIGYGSPEQLVPRSHKRSTEAVVTWV